MHRAWRYGGCILNRHREAPKPRQAVAFIIPRCERDAYWAFTLPPDRAVSNVTQHLRRLLHTNLGDVTCASTTAKPHS